MRKFGTDALFPFDSKVERTCRKNRKIRRETIRLTPNIKTEERTENVLIP